MIPPAIPHNEEQRLRALRALNVLDTPREERFDRITRLAARVFEMRAGFKARLLETVPDLPPWLVPSGISVFRC